MALVALELREDLPPEDVEAQLGASRVRRLFTRSPVDLDREHVRLAEGAPAPPDLCRFYLAEGDRAALAGHPLVVSAVDASAPGEPTPITGAVDDALAALHQAGGRGQGVTIAVLGAAGTLAALAPAAALKEGAATAPLADAIDLESASLGAGDVLVVPHAIAAPAERAAVAVAARRGVLVVASAGEAPGGLVASAATLGPMAARAACVQSLGERLPLAEVVRVLADPDAVSSGVLERAPAPARARVILRRAEIVIGGDLFGTAEIYFEGFVTDSASHPFRLPAEGAYPFVADGQILDLDVILYESAAPLTGPLTVHIEGWDEDLGRDSLVNPDDLLGTHERTYGPDERWGEGVHAEIPLETHQGAWVLTYEIVLF
jgi:hypothetical protein